MPKITKPRNKTQGRRWLAALRFVKRQFANTHYYQGNMLGPERLNGKELRCQLGQLSGYFGVDTNTKRHGLDTYPSYPSDVVYDAQVAKRELTRNERDYVELVQFLTGYKTPGSYGAIVRRNDAGRENAIKANDEYLARVEKVIAGTD
jgi:hypothetical protein